MRSSKRRSATGQSVTDYMALIAFVGVIVAMVFSIGRGALFGSVCSAYSGVTDSLGALNQVAMGNNGNGP